MIEWNDAEITEAIAILRKYGKLSQSNYQTDEEIAHLCRSIRDSFWYREQDLLEQIRVLSKQLEWLA